MWASAWMQASVREASGKGGQEVGGQGLSAAEEAAQGAGRGERGGVDQMAPHGRDELQDSDALVVDGLEQVVRILVTLGAGDDEAGAGHEGGEELPDAGVEAKGGLEQEGVVGAQGIGPGHPGHVVGQGVVWDHDALGPSRGA